LDSAHSRLRMKHRAERKTYQIELRRYEIQRPEVQLNWACSRTVPAVRKQDSPQPLPAKVCGPGDQSDDQNHEIYVLTRAAPERILDKEPQTIDHNDDLCKNDVRPSDSEGEAHCVP